MFQLEQKFENKNIGMQLQVNYLFDLLKKNSSFMIFFFNKRLHLMIIFFCREQIKSAADY